MGTINQNNWRRKRWPLNCLCGMENQSERKKQKERTTDRDSGFESFSRIDKKIRRILRKHCDSEFLTAMDQDILEYISLADLNEKMYSLHDSYQRMICHGVCQYYALNSSSKELKGRRTIVIRKPRNKSIAPPTETLRQYLESLRLCN